MGIGRKIFVPFADESLFLSISLVVLGGDGSVINVINAVLRSIAKENRTK